MMSDVWLGIGTAAVTILLLIVPVLVYGWYVLENMIGDDASYEPVNRSLSMPDGAE